MGILNVTPDSFYSGSRNPAFEDAITKGLQLVSDGADLLDIGGESSRPGAVPVHEQEELNRVLPVIKALAKKTSVRLSIDTIKPLVAVEAIKAGASLLNDVSGFRDEKMIEVASTTQVQICVMHMQGNPQTMQINPHYPEGIIAHLIKWFEQRIKILIDAGIKEEKIIIDPGIGFGKAVADNFEILDNLLKLRKIGFPILLGVSRKTFISKTLCKSYSELLPATLALNACAIQSGVDYIRVHDVKEHRDVIDILTRPA